MPNYRREDIDSGIGDLVDLMNELPFVETYSSCEGHVMSDVRSRHFGYVVTTPGFLTFYVDDNPLAKEFLGRVSRLANKYHYVNFGLADKWPTKERVPYVLKIWSGNYRIRHRSQSKRKREIDIVWKNLYELCKDFVKEFNL